MRQMCNLLEVAEYWRWLFGEDAKLWQVRLLHDLFVMAVEQLEGMKNGHEAKTGQAGS